MPIPQFLLDRIRNSALSGEHLAETFETLATVADRLDTFGNLNLDFTAPGDMLEPNDLVPVLTLSLARPQPLPARNLPEAHSDQGEIIDAEFTVQEHEKYPEE